MGTLSFMITIVDKKRLYEYMEVYQKNNLNVMYLTLGIGTAANDMLDYLGLDSKEKAISLAVVEEDSWLAAKRSLERDLKIDAPGGGIAFLVPLSSVGGKKVLQFLLDKQEYEKKEESTLKDTKHELILAIAEQGYTNMIMDAAKSAGAYGGTVIHAKGTGMQAAEKFIGVSLAAEKEIILIVTKTELKNAIMQAIMKDAGVTSKAKAIVFSLPVTDTAGLRLVEDE